MITAKKELFKFKLVIGYKKNKEKYQEVRNALDYTINLYNDKVTELQSLCVLMNGEPFSLYKSNILQAKTRQHVEHDLVKKIREIQIKNGGIVGTDSEIIELCKEFFKVLFNKKRNKELNDWVYLIYGNPNDTKIFNKSNPGSSINRKELKQKLVNHNIFPMFDSMRGITYKNRVIKNYKFEKMVCETVKRNIKSWNTKLAKHNKKIDINHINIEAVQCIFDYYKKECDLLESYENLCIKEALDKNPNMYVGEYSCRLLNPNNVKKYKYICTRFLKSKSLDHRMEIIKAVQTKYNTAPMDVKFYTWLAKDEHAILWKDSLVINAFIKRNLTKYINNIMSFKYKFTMNDSYISPANMEFETKYNSNFLQYDLLFGEGQTVNGEILEPNEIYLKIPLFSNINNTIEMKDYIIKLSKHKQLSYDELKSIYNNINPYTLKDHKDRESKFYLNHVLKTSMLCKSKLTYIDDKNSNVAFNLVMDTTKKYESIPNSIKKYIVLNFDIDTFLTAYSEAHNLDYLIKKSSKVSDHLEKIYLPGENVSDAVKTNRQHILKEISEWHVKIKVIKFLYKLVQTKQSLNMCVIRDEDVRNWIRCNFNTFKSSHPIILDPNILSELYKIWNEEFNLDFSKWYDNIKNQYIFKRKNSKSNIYYDLNLDIGLSYWGHSFYHELRNLILHWNQRTKQNIDITKISKLKFLNKKIKSIEKNRYKVGTNLLNKLFDKLRLQDHRYTILMTVVDKQHIEDYNKYNNTNYKFISDTFKFYFKHSYYNHALDRNINLNFNSSNNFPNYTYQQLTELDFTDNKVNQNIIDIINYENITVDINSLKVGDYIPNKFGKTTLSLYNNKIYKYDSSINTTKYILMGFFKEVLTKHSYRKFLCDLRNNSIELDSKANNIWVITQLTGYIEYNSEKYYFKELNKYDYIHNESHYVNQVLSLISEYGLETSYENNMSNMKKIVFFKEDNNQFIPTSLNHLQEIENRNFNELDIKKLKSPFYINRDLYDTDPYQRWCKTNEYFQDYKNLLQTKIN